MKRQAVPEEERRRRRNKRQGSRREEEDEDIRACCHNAFLIKVVCDMEMRSHVKSFRFQFQFGTKSFKKYKNIIFLNMLYVLKI